jgi:hypothetical protein
MTTQYDRVQFHGKPVTRRQRQALKAVEQEVGMEFEVMQGSWQPVTKYSSTTHSKAGVCDLWLPRMDDENWGNYVTRVLRRLGGQAAFYRGPWNNMPYHWHTIDLDTTHMDSLAVAQTVDYRAGNDGLGDLPGDPDRNPYRPSPIRRWKFKEA